MIDLKYGKINVPGAPENEPCIVLRAQDAFSVGVLKTYYMFASCGGQSIHAEIIRKTIDAFIAWPKKKVPDTTNEQLMENEK
jgi:hypothetical protein